MRKTILLLSLVATAVAAGSAGARGSATTFTFCTDPSFPPMEYVRPERRDRRVRRRHGQRAREDVRCDREAVEDGLSEPDPGVEREEVRRGDQRHLRDARPPQAGRSRPLHGDAPGVRRASRQPEARDRPEQPQGSERRHAGGDEVRGVPQGTPEEGRASTCRPTPATTTPWHRSSSAAPTSTSPRTRPSRSRPRRIPARSRSRTPSRQKDTFGIYFRKGDPLGAKLRAGVAKLKRNGTLVRLARKYKIPVSDVR